MKDEQILLSRRQIMFMSLLAGGISVSAPLHAQFNIKKALGAADKVAKAATFSEADMKPYFDQMTVEMDSNNPVASAKDPYGKRVAALSKGLQTHDGLNLDVKAYLVKDVNAFAMANGTIRIFAGLMDKMTDDEVRYVIGHEIGHVKRGHTMKRMKSALQADAFKSVASTASGKVARLADSELGKMFGDVISAQHSQSDEREADDYAMAFMKQKQYQPMACVTALEKLDAMGGSGGGLPWLQTHPSPKERAKRMRSQLA